MPKWCTFNQVHHRLFLAALGLVLAGAGSLPLVTVAQTEPDRLAEVRPELRDEVADQAGETRSSYRIEGTLDAAAGTIAGTMDVTFLNDSGSPLDEAYFRLYPNIDYYAEGDLAISAVMVEGVPATFALEVDDSALRVDLPAPLASDESIDIELSFTTTIPLDSAGSYGILSRESSTGTWVLANWHPVLAVFEPGRGWRLDPATPAGDPTHAAAAFYDVTLTAPDDLTVVASGARISEERSAGARTERFVAGPAREFTMVVDNDYVVQRGQSNGVTVSIYTEPTVSSEIARQVLEVSVRALDVFGELFGPYPYTELDVVETPLDGALAVSWSGLIFLDGPSMLGRMATTDPIGFETILAHEVSHLWWGSVVGTNSNDHTFINEGLATLSSVLYLERTAGLEAAALAREQWMLRPARWLLERGDVVADQPAAEHQDQTMRSAAAYGKGSLGFAAIRREIGDEAFFSALRAFAADNRFDIASPETLKRAFALAAGRDLDPLWSHWFNEAALTAEEIASFAE